MPAWFSPAPRQEFFSLGCWLSQGPSCFPLSDSGPGTSTPCCQAQVPLEVPSYRPG